MPSNKLTEGTLRALKGTGSPFKVSDGGGLYLQVTKTGSRLWQLAYRYGEKQRALSIGAYPAISLAAARAAREQAKLQLKSGIDPSNPPDPIEEKLGPTFEDVAKRWFEARKPGWSAGHSARVWSRVDNDLVAGLGNKPIAEVDAKQVLGVLRKIEARKAIETARRVRLYAEDIFAFAKAEDLVAANPASELGRALAVAPPVKRRTALKHDQLMSYLAALDAYPGEAVTKLALRLVLLTFVRTQEIRFAAWSEFEGLAGPNPVWRIPAERMKMRTEHIVPLSSQAIDILTDIRELKLKSDYLFPAATKLRVISENTMIYALYRMGYHSRATVHGFRGTASTILNERNFNRDWIERQLAHSERDGVRAAYNSAEWLWERRRMMQWWADYLDSKRTGQKEPGLPSFNRTDEAA